MTKEELKQEARQKALEWNGEKINGKYNRPPIANWSCYEKGYLAGAEPREKWIAELEEANQTLATMNNNMWVELEKKRAESQGITNKLHQLIKAKELLKGIIDTPMYNQMGGEMYENEEYKELIAEAEQFLSEVEK